MRQDMRTRAGVRLVAVIAWLADGRAMRVTRPGVRSDRGDVPGWVLVTVMTAGLVTALWLVADNQLTALLGRAIQSVSKP